MIFNQTYPIFKNSCIGESNRFLDEEVYKIETAILYCNSTRVENEEIITVGKFYGERNVTRKNFKKKEEKGRATL